MLALQPGQHLKDLLRAWGRDEDWGWGTYIPSASQKAREATATAVLECDGARQSSVSSELMFLCHRHSSQRLQSQSRWPEPPVIQVCDWVWRPCSTSSLSGTHELLKVASACMCHSTMLKGSVLWPCDLWAPELVCHRLILSPH